MDKMKQTRRAFALKYHEPEIRNGFYAGVFPNANAFSRCHCSRPCHSW